jgi:hypothetical protein
VTLSRVAVLPRPVDVGDEVDPTTASRRPPQPVRLQRRYVDGAIVLTLVLVAVALHPIGTVIHRPYWLDEMWVAQLSRAPLSRQLALSSSTPIGWVLLLRLIPGGLDAPLRLVPFTFGVGIPPLAYWFARSLSWPSLKTARAAGVATGAAVLLAPATLVRNDLKQYTADAFFALAILLLAGRVEAAPTRRRMVAFGAVCIVSMLFSTTAIFVVTASLAALFVTALASKSWRAARRVALMGVALGVTIGAYFATVVLPHDNAALRAFWEYAYLPASPVRLAPKVVRRIEAIAPLMSLPALVLIVLVVVGCVSLARLGHRALGTAIGVLWLEMVVAGVGRRYPFLDLRTSHFLIVVSVAVAAVGAVGLASFANRSSRNLPIAVTMCLVVAYASTGLPYVNVWWVPKEGIRDDVAYVAQHRARRDVIVVSLPSNYGFSAYWPDADTEYMRDPAISIGFVTRVRGLRGVVYLDGVTARDTTAGLRAAFALARQQRGRRIWIVRTHLYPEERAAWRTTFHDLGLKPGSVNIGPDAIWIVPAPCCATTSAS